MVDIITIAFCSLFFNDLKAFNEEIMVYDRKKQKNDIIFGFKCAVRMETPNEIYNYLNFHFVECPKGLLARAMKMSLSPC